MRKSFPPHARGWTPSSATARTTSWDSFPPHARGWTRPGAGTASLPEPPFPPHARGWTRPGAGMARGAAVSPARAGMDPSEAPISTVDHRFPRTRGDGPPDTGPLRCLSAPFPPHARGWTRSGDDPEPRRLVSPARAGMDPQPLFRDGQNDVVSPARAGMDPRSRQREHVRLFPPHARGWTRVGRVIAPRGRSRRFPRTRGDGPCERRQRPGREVSPARAGMDPLTVAHPVQPSRFPPHARGWTLVVTLVRPWMPGFPRTRGDGPCGACCGVGLERFPRTRGDGPAHAEGRPKAGCFPRTRGDGPPPGTPRPRALSFPPHARGWTLCEWRRPQKGSVSPARAGMDPPRARSRARWTCSPARAGMDPPSRRTDFGAKFPPHARGWTPTRAGTLIPKHRFPPHARGWTLSRRRGPDAFPPHARGWTPDPLTSRTSSSSFPRTRGDGPIESATPNDRKSAEPVSPARAGMDRRPPRCSPGPEGSSRTCFPRTRGDGPAAGVRPWVVNDRCFPRTRGDGPSIAEFPAPGCRVSPARAGMDPLSSSRFIGVAARFPRTRGDGPCRIGPESEGENYVSPARAGMDPTALGVCPVQIVGRFPRTRGDGPSIGIDARGWDPSEPSVSPARAGMDLPSTLPSALRTGFPHTRGDGPQSTPPSSVMPWFPPHAWGWT